VGTLSTSGWKVEMSSDRNCRASKLNRVLNSLSSPGGGVSSSTPWCTYLSAN